MILVAIMLNDNSTEVEDIIHLPGIPPVGSSIQIQETWYIVETVAFMQIPSAPTPGHTTVCVCKKVENK